MRIFAGLTTFVVVFLVACSTVLGYHHKNQPTSTTCCFASIEMLADNMLDKPHSVEYMTQQFSSYYVGAAKWSLMPAFAKAYKLYAVHYGMDSARDKQSAADRREIKEGLKIAAEDIPYGAEAIVMARGIDREPFKSSIFTKHGHCMVLYGYWHGRFKLSNPNPRSPQSRKGYTMRRLLGAGNIVAIWIFYKH
jgi:hypothetical protein